MKIVLASKPDYGVELKSKIRQVLEELGVDCVEGSSKGCDFAILVGGDGTVLNDQSNLSCPALGVNPGKSVGHYTSADNRDYEKKLRLLVNGKAGKDYRIQELSRLEADLNGKPLKHTCLNEFLISPIYVRRVFKAVLSIEGKDSVEFNSGIMVYTPTGSTAFAASVRAKPLPWNSGKLGIAAIAPYKGILVKGDILLEGGTVNVECMNDEGEICIDGNERMLYPIKRGDVVTVRKHPEPFRLVRFGR